MFEDLRKDVGSGEKINMVSAGLFLLLLGGLLLAAMVMITILVPSARAHEWYDTECCSGDDCHPAAPGDVVETPGGWLIKSLKITVPFAAARISADDQFHLCQYNLGKGDLISSGGRACLYVPPSGI